MEIFHGTCSKCGQEIPQDALGANRCPSCGAPIFYFDNAKELVNIITGLNACAILKKYRDGLAIFDQSKALKNWSNLLAAFYGRFFAYACDALNAQKRRDFVAFLEQNAASERISKKDREIVESLLISFECEDASVVNAIEKFLRRDDSVLKIKNDDSYVAYCIANTRYLDNSAVRKLLGADGVKFANKRTILNNYRDSRPQDAEYFLDLCDMLLSDRNLSRENKEEIGRLINTQDGAGFDTGLLNKSARLASKASRFKDKDGRKFDDGEKSLIRRARQKNLKIAGVAVSLVIACALIGAFVYGILPTGLEALPDNQTTYTYGDELALKYRITRNFSWLESGSVKENDLDIEDFDPARLGEQRIKVVYHKLSTKLTVNLTPRGLTAPGLSDKDGFLVLSGDSFSTSYRLTLGEASIVLSEPQFNLNSWDAAASLAPGTYSLYAEALGNGGTLRDSSRTSIQITKLQAPVAYQSGAELRWNAVTGAVEYAVKKNGILYGETALNSLPLDAADFLPGENAVSIQAKGSGLVIDSAAATCLVQKAATPSFLSSDIADGKITLSGYRYYYRAKGAGDYIRLDALADDLGLLPAEGGEYEVAVQSGGGVALDSDFSAPVTLTRLASPVLTIANGGGISVVGTANYALYYKTSNSSNFVLYDEHGGTVEAFEAEMHVGEYLLQAVALPQNALTLPSVLTSAAFPTAGFGRNLHNDIQFRFSWNSVFSGTESTYLKLFYEDYEKDCPASKHPTYAYYTAYSSNDDQYIEARLYLAGEGFLLLGKYGF